MPDNSDNNSRICTSVNESSQVHKSATVHITAQYSTIQHITHSRTKNALMKELLLERKQTGTGSKGDERKFL
jgi:hypothetical protein